MSFSFLGEEWLIPLFKGFPLFSIPSFISEILHPPIMAIYTNIYTPLSKER